MTQATTLNQAGERSVQRHRSRILTVLVAAGAAALAWTILEPRLGYDLHTPVMGDASGMDIGLAAVVASAAGAGLAAWGSLALLERWTSRPRLIWTALAGAAFLLSLGGPFGGEGIDTVYRWLLFVLHVTVAAVLIPGLARTARGVRG